MSLIGVKKSKVISRILENGVKYKFVGCTSHCG